MKEAGIKEKSMEKEKCNGKMDLISRENIRRGESMGMGAL